MSVIFLKHYSAFHREILAELLPAHELRELDAVYNAAKIIRLKRAARKASESGKRARNLLKKYEEKYW